MINIDNNLVNNVQNSIIGLNKKDSYNTEMFKTYLSQAINSKRSEQASNIDYKNYGVLLCKNLWWQAKSSNNQTLMMSAHSQANGFRKQGATIQESAVTFVDSKYVNAYKNILSCAKDKIVNLAEKYLNIPYVYGGTNTSTGIDCSAFIQSLYNKLGVNLPRTTYEQINVGKKVSMKDLQPGDAVFFNTDSSKNNPSHVGLYIGNGKMIHASSAAGKVITTDFNAYAKKFSVVGIRRYS